MAKREHLTLSVLDIATLLVHVHRGAQLEEKVGFEDCESTLHELTKKLAPFRLSIDRVPLESALWSCNLMDEVGEWWSPTGESFDTFVARIAKGYAFDKFFNLLKKKESHDLAQKLLDVVDAASQDETNSGTGGNHAG